MIKRTFCHIRDDLNNDETIVPTDPQIAPKGLRTLKFGYMVLDRDDGHTIDESHHPDGFNMLILHPETKCIHWAYSIDFDFVDEEPTNIYVIETFHSRKEIYEIEATGLIDALNRRGEWKYIQHGVIDDHVTSMTIKEKSSNALT